MESKSAINSCNRVHSKISTKHSSRSPIQGPSKISNQKFFQITQLRLVQKILGKLHMSTLVHTRSPTPEKFHHNTLDIQLLQKKQPEKTLPHTQPNTHHILPSTLLPLALSLLHLKHGLYQATLVATRVTLYSSSRMDPISGSSTGCSRIYSRTLGLRRYYYPASSHSRYYLFTVSRT